MKVITVTFTLMVMLMCTSCSSSCTIENIKIKGGWDVYKVELVDSENKMEEFIESEGLDYDEYLEGIQLMEQVEYHFKDSGVLKIINPKELGGDGETTYTYVNGSSELTFGGRNYGFEVTNCEEIIITDYFLNKTVKLKMYCKRTSSPQEDFDQLDNELKEKVDLEYACETCLLEEEIQAYKRNSIFGLARGKDQTFIDSLKTIEDSLTMVLDERFLFFQNELNLKSKFFAIDSTRSWCLNSIVFGVDLSKERKDSIFQYLFEEIIQEKHGHFLAQNEHINNSQPLYDENGEKFMWVLDDNQKKTKETIGWERWKETELKKWDDWMMEIDNHIIELHGKPYNEFTEIEQYILLGKLKKFGYD